MKFTTPCFVRVENSEKRHELIVWLKSVGYRHLPFFFQSDNIATEEDGFIWMTDWNRGGTYDFGTNIELFKALAAMNDDNDREQWFIEEGKMFKCTNDKINNYSCHWLTTRKATADEIIEHFKNRESRS